MDLKALKTRLGMFLDQDEAKIELYLERYGAELNMKNIKTIREEVIEVVEPEVEDGENPLFSIKVQCPICKNRAVEAFELLAKSQILSFDPFMMPIYKGAGDYRSVDYPKWAVTVCPKCYFASPDKKDFNVWNRSKKVYQKSQLSSGVILELLDNMGYRKSIVEEYPLKSQPTLIPRTTEAAVNSYLMAIERVKTELDFKINFATFKLASYWLKIALIQRQAELPFKDSLNEARLAMREAYLRTDFPSFEYEYQSTYVLSALELYFGDSGLCREYQASLDRIKADINNNGGAGDINSCLKWIDLSKRLWEDRERSDIWDLPA